MTDEYNITDEEINTTIAKMENQFIKLEKFLDDEKPENKLKDIDKQLKQLNLEKKLSRRRNCHQIKKTPPTIHKLFQRTSNLCQNHQWFVS